MLATPLHDPRPARAPQRAVLTELREGVRWVYRHPTLRPLALTTHTWFVANAAIGTVVVTYLLTVLDVGALGLGVATAAAGAGTLFGTSVAGRVGRRTGGRAPWSAGGSSRPPGSCCWSSSRCCPGRTSAVVVAQLLFGFGMGVEGPFEMSHRQAVTPDRLQGRTNATMRSLNRAAVVVGGPAGGALALATSPRTAWSWPRS